MFLSLDSYELLCRDCLLVGEHQGHRYCTIQAAAGDARDVLKSAMEQVKTKEREVAKMEGDVKGLLPAFERVKLGCYEELDRQFNKIHLALDARKAGLEKAIAIEIDARVDRLQGQLEEAEKAASYIQRVTLSATEAIGSYSDLDLLSAAADVEAELESISRIEASVGPCETAEFACMVDPEAVLVLVGGLGEVQATNGASPSPHGGGSLYSPPLSPGGGQAHVQAHIMLHNSSRARTPPRLLLPHEKPPMRFGPDWSKAPDSERSFERPSTAGPGSGSRGRMADRGPAPMQRPRSAQGQRGGARLTWGGAR